LKPAAKMTASAVSFEHRLEHLDGLADEDHGQIEIAGYSVIEG
jgi:hypothetical protein